MSSGGAVSSTFHVTTGKDVAGRNAQAYMNRMPGGKTPSDGGDSLQGLLRVEATGIRQAKRPQSAQLSAQYGGRSSMQGSGLPPHPARSAREFSNLQPQFEPHLQRTIFRPTTASPFASSNTRWQQKPKEGELRKNSPQSWGPGVPKKKGGACRWQRDIRLEVPDGVFESYSEPQTLFRKMYERGDLPVGVKHGARLGIDWKVPIEALNIKIYFPIFLDGLREKKNPFRFVATEGSMAILKHADEDRLLPCLTEIIRPIRKNLNTKDQPTLVLVIKILRDLVAVGPRMGEALIPYYKYFLPTLNLYLSKKRNLNGETDYGQRHEDERNIAIMVEDLINSLEKAGGADAFLNIKYMVPTYESCIFN